MDLSVTEIGKYIYFLRGQRVMIDSDISEFYEVSTKRLNEQVKRNPDRFPEDFMFRLKLDEFEILRSQFTAPRPNYGGRRHLPYVFTVHGITNLANVLNSSRAIQVNLAIVRAFTQTRESRFVENNSVEPLSVARALKELTHAIQELTALQSSSKKISPIVPIITGLGALGPTQNMASIARPTFKPETKDDLKIDAIKKAVAQYYSIKVQDLKTPSRTKKIAIARQIAIYLIRKHMGLGYSEIGTYFGRKDHTTVMHACRKIETGTENDKKICDAVQAIEGLL